MNPHAVSGQPYWPARLALAGLLLALSACAVPGTPVVQVTATPTASPPPTATPVPPKVFLDINPNLKQVAVGQKVSILLTLDPVAEVKEAKWEFISGGGSLDPQTGEAVVFTAPDQADAVIIQVTGTTADGAPFKQTITFIIVAPTATPEIPPTPTPVPERPFCDKLATLPLPRVRLPASDHEGYIVTPEHCVAELPAGVALRVDGTATEVADGVYLWLLVYASNGRYYPQCNDALKGDCSANPVSGDVWVVKTYLGRKGCLDRFNLVLIETDRAGNEALTETMIAWAKADDFPGFVPSELPVAIRELDSIDVETAGQLCP